MMKIDEAIAHAREVAKNQRKDYDNCKTKLEYGCKDCADYYSKPCNECAEEHEQLAEWLEELESYRASVFSGDMTQAMLKEEYNKAIDDFVEKACEEGIIGLVQYNEMLRIAEQLKAGGTDE